METLLLEPGTKDKLLTDGGDGQPPEGLATAAPAEDPDHNRTFTGIVEQYHIDDQLSRIATAEQVAGPGFKSEAEHQLASTALQGVDVDAEFAAITGTHDMKNLETKAEADIKTWNNPTDSGITFEASPSLSDVDTAGNTLIAQHEIAQAEGWKPELSVVETPDNEGDDTPPLSLVPKQ